MDITGRAECPVRLSQATAVLSMTLASRTRKALTMCRARVPAARSPDRGATLPSKARISSRRPGKLVPSRSQAVGDPQEGRRTILRGAYPHSSHGSPHGLHGRMRKEHAPAVLGILRRAALNRLRTLQQHSSKNVSIGLLRDHIGRQPWILAAVLPGPRLCVCPGLKAVPADQETSQNSCLACVEYPGW